MTLPLSIYDLLEVVLQKIKPTSKERERLNSVVGEIIARVEGLARNKELECETLLVGSAARGTWLAGDHDLDIFIGVAVDSDLHRALELARAAFPIYQERYAEHAYVHAIFEGFEVDLVPFYLVEDASRIKSAVDRTPFHSRYVSAKIKDLEDEVLLLKQFMKGTGVYGSELRVCGFSGYLAELLIIRYGSFVEVLRAAASWSPGVTIDLEKHAVQLHEDPLVLVDPVDPKRNVAAALSLDKMFQFSAASRCFIKSPDQNFFFPREVDPLSDQELLSRIEDRKSTLILIELVAPDMVEDVIYPQLRKAEQSICSLLDRNDFSVLRSDVHWHQDKLRIWMLFELEVGYLPSVKRHIGPPIWQEYHVDRFLSHHRQTLSGPYIDEGKVVVEVNRNCNTATQLLRSQICNLSLGKHLKLQFEKGYKLYVGRELLEIDGLEFRRFMARYFSRRLNIC